MEKDYTVYKLAGMQPNPIITDIVGTRKTAGGKGCPLSSLQPVRMVRTKSNLSITMSCP